MTPYGSPTTPLSACPPPCSRATRTRAWTSRAGSSPASATSTARPCTTSRRCRSAGSRRRAGGASAAPRRCTSSPTSAGSPSSTESATTRSRLAGVSPARNRVTPLGDIEAFPLRGAWTGNRGILHSGNEIVRFHASDLWITCALRFKDWWHEQWQPHHFTWLYFHDEAVSFAAGHRPCALCRRDAYNTYREAWPGPPPSAKEINRTLHGERIVRGRPTRRTRALPGAFSPRG